MQKIGYQETKDGKFLQQAAVVTVDNKTGMITSIVGGRGEHDEFNRGFVMNRQPGSSIKPLLVYGPAINEGIAMPSTIVNDTKVYANGTNSFSPKNAYAGYLGTMPLREAMARSVNTVAFQLFKNIGIKEGLQYLEKLNFTTIDPADYGSASLSLGGFTNGVLPGEQVQILVKAQHNTVSGNRTYNNNQFFFIEHEFVVITKKPSGYEIAFVVPQHYTMDIRDSQSATWKDVVYAVLRQLGASASLDKIYEEIEPHKKTQGNPHWKAKVRQTLQMLAKTGSATHVAYGKWCVA